MKSARHNLILEIIENRDIETQEELAEELKMHGVKVTQATVSRDIRELKLTKVLTGHGGYRYILPPKDSGLAGSKLNHALLESIIMIDVAMNIVVIKTIQGLASAACAMLDSMAIPDLVGSIAGDDTAFLAMRDNQSAEQICREIREMLR